MERVVVVKAVVTVEEEARPVIRDREETGRALPADRLAVGAETVRREAAND